MKIKKIEPKDRLTDYTHIEIQGIIIPLNNIKGAASNNKYLTIETYGKCVINKNRFEFSTLEEVEDMYNQVVSSFTKHKQKISKDINNTIKEG